MNFINCIYITVSKQINLIIIIIIHLSNLSHFFLMNYIIPARMTVSKMACLSRNSFPTNRWCLNFTQITVRFKGKLALLLNRTAAAEVKHFMCVFVFLPQELKVLGFEVTLTKMLAK